MGFFYDNPVIEFLHRITRKPSTVLMWLFTGIIVASTSYLMFLPGGPRELDDHDRCIGDRDRDGSSRSSGSSRSLGVDY